MNIQSSIPDSQMYSTSRQARVLGGLTAPAKTMASTPAGDTKNSLMAGAKAQSSQAQAAARSRMADANLANQLTSQDARSKDLQNLAGIYGQQYVDMAQRNNAYRQLDSRQQIYNIDDADDVRDMKLAWYERLMSGLTQPIASSGPQQRAGQKFLAQEQARQDMSGFERRPSASGRVATGDYDLAMASGSGYAQMPSLSGTFPRAAKYVPPAKAAAPSGFPANAPASTMLTPRPSLGGAYPTWA